jgi:putative hydrolase of the HAD superfamily
VIRAAIFDWHGTLARWETDGTSNYRRILAEHGYEVEQAVFDRFFVRWDGVDHIAHSASREAYLAWTRSRLSGLVVECGVEQPDAERVAQALFDADFAMPMVAFPESAAVLTRLRRLGVATAVCSNWGWDLDPFLDATGLAPLLDLAVSSARVGYRKPHPSIYRSTLDTLDVAPAEAVFIGDSWGPDVLGPMDIGIGAAVHVCRDAVGAEPPLPEGAHRVRDLEEIFGVVPFADPKTPPVAPPGG